MKQYGSCIVCLIFLLVVVPAHAQDDVDEPGRFALGGALGVNIATLGGQHADMFSDPTYRVGVAMGGLANLRLHEWIAVQIELLYATKGSGREIDGIDIGPFISTYLDIPLAAHIQIPLRGRIKPYAIVGARLSVLLDAKVEYTDGTTINVKDITTSLDYGLLFGAGAGFALSANSALTGDLRYDLSLKTIDNPQDLEPFDIKSRVFALLVGYRYRF